MKNLSVKLQEILQEIREKKIASVSFDIDGTLYPIKKVELRWWKLFLVSPLSSIRFLAIRKHWEKKRAGLKEVRVLEEDIRFFEDYLLKLLDPKLVPEEIKTFLETLSSEGVRLFFLSDHGTKVKLMALGLKQSGEAVNCLSETGELKPHSKIATLFMDKFHIAPEKHLHLGDRWTDEEQAKLMRSHFHYLAP